ncbi:MAG: AAA family ATPase [Pseudomonadota bacterium]
MATLTELIKNYAEERGEYTATLIYGDSGSGKTTLSSTWPKPFLYLDFGMGLRTLQNLGFTNIPHIPFRKADTKKEEPYRKAMGIIEELGKEKGAGYKTLIIDDGTAMADLISNGALMHPYHKDAKFRLPTNNKPNWDDYNALQERLKDVIGRCLDLPMHFVLTALTTLEKDENRGTYIGKPNLKGGYRDKIEADFDYVLYLVAEKIKTNVHYRCYTIPEGYFKAKVRGKFKPVYENATFDKLFGKEEEVPKQ